MDARELPAPPAAAEVELAGCQRLLVSTGADASVLRLVGADGAVHLTVTVSADGPVLRFEGAALRIEAPGDLALSARRISLHGEDSVALTTGGDALLSAGGKLTTEAQQHAISVLREGEPGGQNDVAPGTPGTPG